MRTGAADAAQVHAQLPRQHARGWSGRDQAFILARGRKRFRRRMLSIHLFGFSGFLFSNLLAVLVFGFPQFLLFSLLAIFFIGLALLLFRLFALLGFRLIGF